MSTEYIPSQLEELKTSFASEIGSPRDSERIETIKDLIQVLHDRDTFYLLLGPHYNTDNITVDDLYRIADRLRTKDTESILPEILLEKLAAKIGQDWKQLAEFWKINDVDCDSSAEESAKNLLLKFQVSCGRISPKEFEFRLIRGFRKCGRIDLEELILQLSSV